MVTSYRYRMPRRMAMSATPTVPYRSSSHSTPHKLLCRDCARILPRGDMPLAPNSPFTRVLICTDGSPLGNDAVALGVAVAQMAGASIVFLHAAMPWKGGAWLARMFAAGEVAVDPEAAALAEASLDRARGLAMNAGVRFETRLAYNPHPERAILDMLHDTGCDLIVMGARSGRRSRRVAARACVPLLTCQTFDRLHRSRAPPLTDH
jgi:nucleotide-binding universal stress UspA family protein